MQEFLQCVGECGLVERREQMPGCFSGEGKVAQHHACARTDLAVQVTAVPQRFAGYVQRPMEQTVKGAEELCGQLIPGGIEYKVAYITTAQCIKLIPLTFGGIEKGFRGYSHVGGCCGPCRIGFGKQVAPEFVRCVCTGEQAAHPDDRDGFHATRPVTL